MSSRSFTFRFSGISIKSSSTDLTPIVASISLMSSAVWGMYGTVPFKLGLTLSVQGVVGISAQEVAGVTGKLDFEHPSFVIRLGIDQFRLRSKRFVGL